MKQSANARFAIKAWDEKPYSEGQDQPRLTRASVTKTYIGDIEGEGQVEYLMMYRSDGSATFVGLERVVGRIGGKAGTFVLQRTDCSKAGRRRSPILLSPAPQLETCRASWATAAPPLGTAWSIRSP